MNGKMSFVKALVLLTAAAGAFAPAARAAGVVSVCDELHLRGALQNGGAVTFACSGVITLANTLTISIITSIDGTGQNVVLDGGHAVGIIQVNVGTSVRVNSLTFQNGSALFGGGVHNRGTLFVDHCTFSGNSGTGSGGAINNDSGTAFISSSTFSGNTSTLGGGVINTGTLSIVGSTLSANTASNAGGGIDNEAGMTIVNSTFTGNSAQVFGAAIGGNGGGTVTSSTFSGNNAPGVQAVRQSAVTLKNTLLANNSGGSCARDGFRVVTDGGYNLDDDGSCGFTAANQSLSNNSNANVGALSGNGGPTQTIPLLSGSAAIGVIPPGVNGCATTVAVDQRGVARPGSVTSAGLNCSIGAYEFVSPPAATITDCSSDGQLRTAISQGGRIIFGCSGSIFVQSALNIASNTSIDATGQSVRLRWDGGEFNILNVNQGFALSLNGLTVTDFNGFGGAIHSEGLLIISNSKLSGNNGRDSGGAIASIHATLIVTRSSFSGNISGGLASAIGSFATVGESGTATILDSTFSGNSSFDGAAIFANTPLTVEGCTFSGNAPHAIGAQNVVGIARTILAGNGANCGNFGGVRPTDNGYNLDDDGSCGLTQTGSLSNNKNAALGTLSDNGGPTLTIPLNVGSAALDAIPLGVNGCGTTPDQRGVFRPQGTGCDMGAYEANQTPVAFGTADTYGNSLALAVTAGSLALPTPQAPFLLVGGQYDISTASPQAGTTGTQYVWQNWSDGLAQSHTVTVSATPAAYIATFQTQYLLSTGANPANGGSVSVLTPGNNGYYPAGASVNLSAMANLGYQFVSWTGWAATTAATRVIMTGPLTVTANFKLTPQVSLTGPASGSAVYGASFLVSATTNSGATPAITVAGPCRISGTTVTMAAGTGTCQFQATWPETAQYASATALLNVGALPATITVQAKSYSITFGQPIPPLAATYSGFVTPDTAASVLSGSPQLSTSATSYSIPSTYPIVAAKGTLAVIGSNYVLAFVNGTLTINATASVPASGTACNGVYTGAFRGNILVGPGQVCIIDGGSVSGTLVSLGGIVGLYNATVGGDVGIGGKYTGSATNLQHSVCGSTLKSSLVFLLDRNPVTIGGAAGSSCGPNTINGILTVTGDSSQVTVLNNTVKGSAALAGNTAPVNVSNNIVGDTLACTANSSITGSQNTAKHKTGQCSRF